VYAEESERPCFVILDSFDRHIAQGKGDCNDAASVQRVWSQLQPLIDCGIGVLIVDHTSTRGGARGQIGSTHKESGADMVLLMVPTSTGGCRVQVRKDRDGLFSAGPGQTVAFTEIKHVEGGDVEIHLVPAIARLAEVAQEAIGRKEQAKAFILEQCAVAPRTHNYLKERWPAHLKGTDCGKRQVQRILDEMVEAGLLIGKVHIGKGKTKGTYYSPAP